MISISFIDKRCKDNEDLIKRMDSKIADEAKKLLDFIRFRVKNCNTSTEIALISDYRRILEDKLRGSDCYEEYSTSSIINIIKKLIR